MFVGVGGTAPRPSGFFSCYKHIPLCAYCVRTLHPDIHTFSPLKQLAYISWFGIAPTTDSVSRMCQHIMCLLWMHQCGPIDMHSLVLF